MNTIILVRHGESESNTDKRFTGQLDSPLTATGKEQARLTAKYLDKYKIDKEEVFGKEACDPNEGL